MKPDAALPSGPEPYKVRLENFEGPLDLLLHLIRREEMNIYDIPIARITEQYLEIIQDLVAEDIDRASEFLVMAATLLGIKSRMLLPKPPKAVQEEGLEEEPEMDPREELVRQLVAYSHFKQVAQELKEREAEMSRVYTRSLYLEEPTGPRPLVGLSMADLVKAFQEVLKDEWNWREVPREEIPLREKIREMNLLLSRSQGGIRFQDLFTRGGSRLEVIVTFLAMLELIKQRKVVVWQHEMFGTIMLRKSLPSDEDQENPEAEDTDAQTPDARY